MASMKTDNRTGRKSHASAAVRAGRTGRPGRAVAAAAASGLEKLETRMLMSAVRPDAAFSAVDLGVGDDRSFPTSGSAGYSLGFSAPINFFGSMYSGVFVNNNGHVSLGARNSFYANADLDSLAARVIAPFYANVDTRFAGNTVRYGRGTVDGHNAFAVNWLNVDYYPSIATHTNRNSFQLVLVDRSDLGAGNFDMEFNYDQIAWESGANSGGDADGLGGSAARVGWTANNGTLEGVFQMAGSNVAGSFLDGNAVTGLVHNSFMSDEAGRYVFRFRGGTWADAPTGGSNTAPVVSLPSDVTVVESANGTAYLDLAGSFEDPDANNWFATVDYGDGWGTQPLSLDAAKGFSLQNAYFATGSHTVTVTVDDGAGGVAVHTLNVLVEDHSAPVVDVTAPRSLFENQGGVLSFSLANDTDLTDSYTYEWTGSGAADEYGDFHFHADDNGTYLVSLKVTDPSGNSTVVEVPLTVENVAPTASGLSGADSLDEGGTLSLSLDGAGDASPADLAAGLLYSFDFDGDGVFEVVGASATASHVFDDNGHYTVRARVTDKDGGYSDYTHGVHVRNVPPRRGHFTDNNPVAEGAPVTVSFGGQEDPSAADTAAGFTYSFDFDGDGVFEVSGGSPSASFAFADNGVFVVAGRVTDKDGGYTDYTTDIEVYNVAPNAAGLAAMGPAVEGSAVTLSLDGASDPSAADRAAGFTYSFDLDNDGVFDVTGSSATVNHLFRNDGNYTVRARVTDKDGGFTDHTASVVISNAAPVITSVTNSGASLGAVSAGSAVNVVASFTDAGVLDGHSAVIDWGDGTTSTLAASGSNGRGGASASHAYAMGGVYTVTVTVSDDARPAGVAVATTTAYVTGVGLHNGVVQVVGTNGDDRVSVSTDNRGNLKVRTDFAPDALFGATAVREIRATLGAGRDSFTAAHDVTTPMYVNGVRFVNEKGGGRGVAGSITRSLFSDRLVA